MTTIVIAFAFMACGAGMAWLGYRLAALTSENKRLKEVSAHQDLAIGAMMKVAEGQRELQDELKQINDLDPEELNAYYNRLIGGGK